MAAAASFIADCQDSAFFSEVRGYELMRSKVEESRLLLDALAHQHAQVVEADFLREDWSSASVVYACATCFDSVTMRALEETKFPLLRPGACVIVIDKELSTQGADLPSTLQLIASCQVNTTWGPASARVFLSTRRD